MTGVIAGEAAERLAGQGGRWHPHASPHVETKRSAPRTWPSPPAAIRSLSAGDGKNPARSSPIARAAVARLMIQYTASASSGR
jgi:hypothetical protein